MKQNPSPFLYCPSLTDYKRFKTREVQIGELTMGGNNPIRVQSMTTTDTMDTLATVEQSIRLIESGCELVRITAPSIKEAENLANIKREIRARGYNTPLVADIHFTPNAAEVAARIVEKVRINPGNFVDKKKFEQLEYTDLEYQAEIERIQKRFVPLVKICKEYGTAMRIGTNHGSLSDRILSRYGDTPEGMVESAMEFLRIARAENYHNLVLSMKASNTQVMIQAYRLLVHTMMKEEMDYPLHLGVTEAGDGEDGRIKSAVGIGTLLEDGLGDTIRVSLTEDPEKEIPVARKLVDRYRNRKANLPIQEYIELPNPFVYEKRKTKEVMNFGGKNVPRVIIDVDLSNLNYQKLNESGYLYHEKTDKYHIHDMAADWVVSHTIDAEYSLPTTLGILQPFENWQIGINKQSIPIVSFSDEKLIDKDQAAFIRLTIDGWDGNTINQINSFSSKPRVLVIESKNEHTMPALRRFLRELATNGIYLPAVVHLNYDSLNDPEEFQLHASTDAGALFAEGLCEGIWLSAIKTEISTINSTSFGILQATRQRISKTEYIACPSCGRTLFDLQETTALIRKRTSHLKGVKIGIMGCIVNGPGEMADADYGYVGSGPGKITLYKGKEIVQRNVPSAKAVEALVDLIKANNDWVEPILL